MSGTGLLRITDIDIDLTNIMVKQECFANPANMSYFVYEINSEIPYDGDLLVNKMSIALDNKIKNTEALRPVHMRTLNLSAGSVKLESYASYYKSIRYKLEIKSSVVVTAGNFVIPHTPINKGEYYLLTKEESRAFLEYIFDIKIKTPLPKTIKETPQTNFNSALMKQMEDMVIAEIERHNFNMTITREGAITTATNACKEIRAANFEKVYYDEYETMAGERISASFKEYYDKDKL